MRGGKSFLVMVLVLAGLGGYLYFVESKRSPSDDTPKKDKVFNVEADKIDEITVKSESGERTGLKRNGTTWAIVQPAAGRPDDTAVSGLTSSLASLEMQRVIDENPSELKEFGLAEPRIEVAFKTGGQERRLLLGQKTPSGTDLYAKMADQKKVFLISSYLESTFNKSTFDLRDKTVLKIDREKLDSVEVTTPERSMRFEKANAEWKMTRPSAVTADFSAVEALVGRLTGAHMDSIVSAEDGDLKAYGLDKPAATVRVGSGSSQATLLLGSAAGEGKVHGKDLSRPGVFTIESALLDELKKEPSDFRQKDLFAARSFSATRLEIARNGQTTVFEKTKTKDKDGKEEEKWRQTAPAGRDIDAAKMEGLFSAATGARAASFVDNTAKTGLDKPELAIVIKFDEGKSEDRVSFARAGTDGYASRTGWPGAAKVDIGTIDAIVKAFDGTQEQPKPEPPKK